jgi:hypothetical protein
MLDRPRIGDGRSSATTVAPTVTRVAHLTDEQIELLLRSLKHSDLKFRDYDYGGQGQEWAVTCRNGSWSSSPRRVSRSRQLCPSVERSRWGRGVAAQQAPDDLADRAGKAHRNCVADLPLNAVVAPVKAVLQREALKERGFA